MMQPQLKELSIRGDRREEDELFSYVPLEDRVPANPPLGVTRKFVHPMLAELSPRFDGIYAKTGRPSIPPEHATPTRSRNPAMVAESGQQRRS